MRVTNASLYRNYTSQINSVHANLNKSFNKVSSGREYEAAADSPLSYYKGKEIDNQYRELLAKNNLLTDVKNRLYQQETGARDIQNRLSTAKKEVIKANTVTTSDTAKSTIHDELLQIEHTMVNDLLTQYQDYYVYGGNDASTPPFALSADGMTLTYTHTFPGKKDSTEFVMELGDDGFKLVSVTNGSESDLLTAMKEQGHMDLGYGDIRDRDTLLDTYTGGMNLLTGIPSDAVKTDAYDVDAVLKALTDGPLGMVAQAVRALDKYKASGNGDDLSKDLGRIMDEMTLAEQNTSTVYSDLGNKYNLLENLDTKQKSMMDSLTEQYKDAVGANPYASIVELYNNQYSYNASLQVGSYLMGSSLFDFIR